MHGQRIVTVLALAVTVSSMGLAQSTVQGLEDLAGVSAAMGEFHLARRGYVLSHSDKVSYATFHYYSKGENCIVVEDKNDRYESLRMTPPENCRNNGFRPDQVSINSLQDTSVRLRTNRPSANAYAGIS